MWPVILQLGPLKIYAFGAMIAVAFLAASWITAKELARRGLPEQAASTIMLWAAVGGIGGAKLWSLLQDIPAVWNDPIGTISSASGLVWYGGLVGGMAAVSWSIHRQHLPWLIVCDCIAPALALGHGIGRIGCQLAGDGDWGTVSDVPWAMAYPNAIIGWPHPPGVRVHPTPVYEMLAYFAVFAALWAMRKRPHADGTLLWWYLVLACSARFVVEFYRINPPVALGLGAAQWFSLLMVGIGGWRLWTARGPATLLGAAARL